ncbi:MAG TPA: hypothetical protein VKZ79_18220 [Alphaproteobacteria bacterium]|nr:hypothetical protein [Alphaproteobacteria bacterium]
MKPGPTTTSGSVNDTPNYAWTRFWVPRTGSINLGDGGFMVDPAEPLLWSSGTAPTALPELERYPGLVLLGEPGIGKSDTLKVEALRLQARADGSVSVHVDLRSFSSEAFLFQRVFESPEMASWKSDQSHLTLHLDSLDEALLRIDSIANLITAELPNLPTDRMSLRIACRTAVWPEMTLEPVLQSIWGEDRVGVFELAPLRRTDVIAAAHQEGIDPAAFVTELYAANAVPFAIKPLTLKLLLTLYARDQKLPRRLTDLYMQGCLSLCEEQNPSRRDTRRTGSLNARQRLRIAGKLACVTMFANRYAIWTGLETDAFPPEDVALSKIAVGVEQGEFPEFEVTENAVREVLDTGLFNARGPSRIGWAHQSYAEFLAAAYLIEKAVSATNILRLLLHPAGGLIPQLAVVAAWVASLNHEVRTELISNEPLALLHGDLAAWSQTDIARLTSSLLKAYDEQRTHDFMPGRLLAYSKLAHPGLADKLQPYLKDRSKNAVVRRASFDIAEACSVTGLTQELVDVAFDPSDDATIRSRAISALGACGDASFFPQLLPFARDEIGPDSNCEIKGQALKILWPNFISAADLFSIVTQPNDGFFGAYAHFLTHKLPKTLTVGDLTSALSWSTQF